MGEMEAQRLVRRQMQGPRAVSPHSPWARLTVPRPLPGCVQSWPAACVHTCGVGRRMGVSVLTACVCVRAGPSATWGMLFSTSV